MDEQVGFGEYEEAQYEQGTGVGARAGAQDDEVTWRLFAAWGVLIAAIWLGTAYLSRGGDAPAGAGAGRAYENPLRAAGHRRSRNVEQEGQAGEGSDDTKGNGSPEASDALEGPGEHNAADTAATTPAPSAKGGGLFGRGARREAQREESHRDKRAAAVARLQAAQDSATAKAAEAENKRREAARAVREAQRAEAEKAAAAKAAAEARERQLEAEARALAAKRIREREEAARVATLKAAARAAEDRRERADIWAKQSTAASAADVRVYAKVVGGGGGGNDTRHLLSVKISDTVTAARAAVSEASGIAQERVTLVLNGAILNDPQAALVDAMGASFSDEVTLLVLAR